MMVLSYSVLCGRCVQEGGVVVGGSEMPEGNG